MTATAKRCVIVERPTEYRQRIDRHGTRQQAQFFLGQRGLEIDELERRHNAHEQARAEVVAAIPRDWRQAAAGRRDLPGFLFEPDDVVVVIGQDGLVANTAKYLDGQPVIGIDPDPGSNPGVLVPHRPSAFADLRADVDAGRATIAARTMIRATVDDGREIVALNEIFIGHRTHQSARYTLKAGDSRERQSSSGVIVASGTGSTGWAQSINRDRGEPLLLPAPIEPALAWFVREAWSGPGTGTSLGLGRLATGEALELTCENGDDGVVFGDGIEDDRLALDWGAGVRVEVADRRLMHVTTG